MGLSSVAGCYEGRLINPDAWREDALCKDLNVNGWVALPKSLCFECPVRKECLWDAIVNDDYQISHNYHLGGRRSDTGLLPRYGYQPYLTRGGVMAPERKRVYNLCNGDSHKMYDTLIDLHFRNYDTK